MKVQSKYLNFAIISQNITVNKYYKQSILMNAHRSVTNFVNPIFAFDSTN